MFYMKTPYSSQSFQGILNKTKAGTAGRLHNSGRATPEEQLSGDCFHTGRPVGHSSARNGVVGAVASVVALMNDQ